MTLGVDSGIGIRRALFSVDPARMPCEELDVLVVGSGIAGLTVATSLGSGLRVAVTTKGSLFDGSTWYAQGGVAASLGADDTPGLHLEDTLAAGSGLCDDGAVRILVDDASDAIHFLERSGLRLDRDGSGRALTREGGHSRNRIVHAGGDATGAAIVRALLESARGIGITTYERTFVADLLRDDHGGVAGAVLVSSGGVRVVRCGTVVLATGGYGQLFSETTSPVTCTGDGAAAALRAGAHLADLEFVQFHPTTLALDRDPRPLISEAVRGEGAVLRDGAGEPVTEGVHPLGDLAPRDIVARAVAARMGARGEDHVYLDATRLGGAFLERRFPTIMTTCRSLGIDPATEPIPVSPAAHYTMGGIRTDLDGRTNLPGLFAVGEVAASGVHGANRLASNSLLEGVVYGRRVAVAVDGGGQSRGVPMPIESTGPEASARPADDAVRVNLRRSMVERAGVVRSSEGLSELLAASATSIEGPVGRSIAACEIENMLELATGLALLAFRREESRGAHFRSDFPSERDSWHRHQVLVRGSSGSLEVRRIPVGVEAPTELAEVG